MAQPTPQDVHVDRALSNVSIAYKNEAYIADRVFPIVEVDKQSDYYFIYTKDFWFRNLVKRRGPGATYPEGGFELSSTQYYCINRGLSFPVVYETVANQDEVIDLEDDGAEWLADQFQLNREISLAAAIMDASAWTSSTTLSGTSQWSDYANSDPIGDVETGKETIKKLIGMYPNKLIMGAEVWDKLKFHPDLLDIYKHTNVAVLTKQQVAAVFDIGEIVVGDAVQNSSEEGAAFSGAFIWPKNALLAYINPSPGRKKPSAGYTYMWRNQQFAGLTVPIRRFEEPKRNRALLLGDNAYDQKVTGADCGYEVIDAVA